MLVRWAAHPAQMNNGLREFGRIFDEAFGFRAGGERGWIPAADVSEDAKRYQLTLEIPGVRPEDVKVELDGHHLTVGGRKKEQTFSRVFTLPETVATEGIEAGVQDGGLTLVLPKIEKAQPRLIAVKAA